MPKQRGHHGNKARNDAKFKAWLKKKRIEENPIRFRVALPRDIDLKDIAWKPDWRERGFSKLAELDAKFEKQERAYRELRIRIAQRMLEEDRKWLADHAND